MVYPDSFSLKNKTAVVTGGGGGLGSAIADGLARAGARLALTGLTEDRAARAAEQCRKHGCDARAYVLNVLEEPAVRDGAQRILDDFGHVDVLVNCVGGNIAAATTGPDRSFFETAPAELRAVLDLNLVGGVIQPCQAFGRAMADNPGGGAIINISSMAADRPLTRVLGYSAAKAAVNNFTKWLAVHLAQEYSPQLRVNAVAPGFFLTEQNRFLLQDEAGALTERGKQILAQTPMARFGEPGDLAGAVVWLASDAARFVTGAVIPVDGGFSAYAGV